MRSIQYNPYDEYDILTDKTNVGYLEKEDVEKIINLKLPKGSHLEKIKD